MDIYFVFTTGFMTSIDSESEEQFSIINHVFQELEFGDRIRIGVGINIFLREELEEDLSLKNSARFSKERNEIGLTLIFPFEEFKDFNREERKKYFSRKVPIMLCELMEPLIIKHKLNFNLIEFSNEFEKKFMY